MKIAINVCHGGFCLSEEAYKKLGIPWDKRSGAYSNEKMRTDPKLIEVIEKLGPFASGKWGQVIVKEIPDGSPWEIEENNGRESLVVPKVYY